MGSIIGKESVAEPKFKVLLTSSVTTNGKVPYEIREYGKRFVAQIEYPTTTTTTATATDTDDNNTGPAFRALARYIGVFNDPENHGNTKIDMTAPVSMHEQQQKGTKIAMTAPVAMHQQQPSPTIEKGTKIAMTAPVVMHGNNSNNNSNSLSDTPATTKTKVMKFFLPAGYESLEQIPKPTNPNVQIVEVPPEVGAVYRFSGTYSTSINDRHAIDLVHQLRSDMMMGSKEEMKKDEQQQEVDADTQKLLPPSDEASIKSRYQFWAYNPPFCLPPFRRNEVWVPLTRQQVEKLIQNQQRT